MSRTRFQGTMVEDHLIHMEDSSGLTWITAWRCINCGHAVDPVMAANRQLLNTAVLSPAVHDELIHDAARGTTHDPLGRMSRPVSQE